MSIPATSARSKAAPLQRGKRDGSGRGSPQKCVLEDGRIVQEQLNQQWKLRLRQPHPAEWPTSPRNHRRTPRILLRSCAAAMRCGLLAKTQLAMRSARCAALRCDAMCWLFCLPLCRRPPTPDDSSRWRPMMLLLLLRRPSGRPLLSVVQPVPASNCRRCSSPAAFPGADRAAACAAPASRR